MLGNIRLAPRLRPVGLQITAAQERRHSRERPTILGKAQGSKQDRHGRIAQQRLGTLDVHRDAIFREDLTHQIGGRRHVAHRHHDVPRGNAVQKQLLDFTGHQAGFTEAARGFDQAETVGIARLDHRAEPAKQLPFQMKQTGGQLFTRASRRVYPGGIFHKGVQYG